jgi:hypothetical protein
MNGVGGRSGWQWYVHFPIYHLINLAWKRIFILEGILTVFVSLIAYFIVPTWSHKAKFVRVFLLFRHPKTSTFAAI